MVAAIVDPARMTGMRRISINGKEHLWLAVGILYLTCVGIFCIVGVQRALGPTGWPGPRPPYIPINDFGQFWMAGSLALQGHAAGVYDPHVFSAAIGGIGGHATSGLGWYYPPQSLLLAVPFALLPPVISYLVWVVGVLLAGSLAMRAAGYPRWMVVATCLSPASFLCALLGQRGAFVAMLAAAAAAGIFNRRAGYASVLGILVVKPAAVVLLPIVMLARGQWKALGGAVGIGVLFTAASLLAFGWRPFENYWVDTRPLIEQALKAGYLPSSGNNATSVFWMARSFGAGIEQALFVQGLATIACAASLFEAVRRGVVSLQMAVALALILSPAMVAYCYNYDLVGHELGVAMAVHATGRPIGWRDGLFWIMPGFTPMLYGCLGFGVTPLLIFGAAINALASAKSVSVGTPGAAWGASDA
jgi:hypothetical protein